MTYVTLVSNLIMQGRKRTHQLTGFDPQAIHVPSDKTQHSNFGKLAYHNRLSLLILWAFLTITLLHINCYSLFP